jgi:hypothetical protein
MGKKVLFNMEGKFRQQRAGMAVQSASDLFQADGGR